MNGKNSAPAMRRHEREITERAEIMRVIDRCEVCRIGVSTSGAPYIVPLSFGFTDENGLLRFYFHHSMAGRLTGLLRENPFVAFELDHPIAFLPGDIPSHASYAYESVMGEGKIEFLEDPAEKADALNHMMRHYTGQTLHDFTESCIRKTAVLRLSVEWITAKHGME